MKIHYLFFTSLLLLANTNFAQLPFKFDSLYNTIHAREFCELKKKHPELLLVDVRSKGEYSDTSRYAGLNQGHLKGAINIEIDAIKNDVSIMNKYKERTLVLYCSHSQRSRRVSKLLKENGFVNIYNLNGGMSVLNQLSDAEFPCKKDFIQTGLPFKNLSFNDAANLVKNEKQLVVIDVRPPTQFASTDTIAANNVGRIRGAINVPYQDLLARTKESLNKYKSHPVLVYSSSGDGDGSRMAMDMVGRGFVYVYHLLGGIQNFVASQDDLSIMENQTPYKLLNAKRALTLLQTTPSLAIYDTRPNDEYSNKLTGTVSYKNLGHMKNANHVEEVGFSTVQLPPDKNASVLVYGNEEAFVFVKILNKKGYRNVYLLDSLYDFVWSGFNIESCSDIRNYVENHTGLY